MFTEDQKSTFPYWFAHWCSFQMVALNWGVWRWKYLFHDWEKPWLRLFFPYETVREIHRNHSRHHFEYWDNHSKDLDWVAILIDWECSKYTKNDCGGWRSELEHLREVDPPMYMIMKRRIDHLDIFKSIK